MTGNCTGTWQLSLTSCSCLGRMWSKTGSLASQLSLRSQQTQDIKMFFLYCEESDSWRRLLNGSPVGHDFPRFVTWILISCLVKQNPFPLFLSSNIMAPWRPVCKCQHFFLHHLYCQDEDSKAGNCPGCTIPSAVRQGALSMGERCHHLYLRRRWGWPGWVGLHSTRSYLRKPWVKMGVTNSSGIRTGISMRWVEASYGFSVFEHSQM